MYSGISKQTKEAIKLSNFTYATTVQFKQFYLVFLRFSKEKIQREKNIMQIAM